MPPVIVMPSRALAASTTRACSSGDLPTIRLSSTSTRSPPILSHPMGLSPARRECDAGLQLDLARSTGRHLRGIGIIAGCPLDPRPDAAALVGNGGIRIKIEPLDDVPHLA